MKQGLENIGIEAPKRKKLQMPHAQETLTVTQALKTR